LHIIKVFKLPKQNQAQTEKD